MITDIEMEAMEMLVADFLNRAGFEREHYALGAMQDMLAALNSDWFSSASDEEKKAYVHQFSSAIAAERARVDKENGSTRWICVYKDIICRHADIDNLVNIEVPTDWLYKALKDEGETDIEAWFDEYTADSCDNIAIKAVAEGVILNCDDEYAMKSILFNKEHPELINDADKVKGWIDSFKDYNDIPEALAFDFKGTAIKNPFYDETLRFDVDPFVYYGEENIKNYINTAEMLMGNLDLERSSAMTIANDGKYQRDMAEAMTGLQSAWNKCKTVFGNVEYDCNDYIVDDYPFDKSFDDVDIDAWCNATLSKLNATNERAYNRKPSLDSVVKDCEIVSKEQKHCEPLPKKETKDLDL